MEDIQENAAFCHFFNAENLLETEIQQLLYQTEPWASSSKPMLY